MGDAASLLWAHRVTITKNFDAQHTVAPLYKVQKEGRQHRGKAS